MRNILIIQAPESLVASKKAVHFKSNETKFLLPTCYYFIDDNINFDAYEDMKNVFASNLHNDFSILFWTKILTPHIKGVNYYFYSQSRHIQRIADGCIDVGKSRFFICIRYFTTQTKSQLIVDLNLIDPDLNLTNNGEELSIEEQKELFAHSSIRFNIDGALDDNNWHRIGIVHHEGNVKLVLDNTEMSQDYVVPTRAQDVFFPPIVGGLLELNPNNNNQEFAILCLSYYNRVLSPSELLAHYNNHNILDYLNTSSHPNLSQGLEVFWELSEDINIGSYSKKNFHVIHDNLNLDLNKSNASTFTLPEKNDILFKVGDTLTEHIIDSPLYYIPEEIEHRSNIIELKCTVSGVRFERPDSTPNAQAIIQYDKSENGIDMSNAGPQNTSPKLLSNNLLSLDATNILSIDLKTIF